MNKHTQETSNGIGTLAEDACALMTATADVAGERVAEAREKLAAALESGKEMYTRVRRKAIKGARMADQTVRENPYQAVGIAVGTRNLLSAAEPQPK